MTVWHLRSCPACPPMCVCCWQPCYSEGTGRIFPGSSLLGAV